MYLYHLHLYPREQRTFSLPTMISPPTVVMAAMLLALCLATAHASDEVVTLRWLHIEKCGQSFATTILLWGCPDDIALPAIQFLEKSTKPSKVAYMSRMWPVNQCTKQTTIGGDEMTRRILPPVESHHPINASRDLGSIAVVFREPSSRLRSHHAYFGGKQFALGRQTALMTGAKGGQTTSMVEAKRAVHMLESSDVAFAGILEHWNASILLFHCLFMPHQRPHQVQLQNLHPSKYNHRNRGEEVPMDPADSVVYSAAVRRFHRDLKTHRTCLLQKAARWQIAVGDIAPSI